MSRSPLSQGLVNHVALLLDASGSMSHLQKDVIKVVDQQIAYLAKRSQELDQETRVSVYVFGSSVRCIIWDKDVLRLPSIREHYKDGGMTALRDAAMISQRDLGEIPERHGDHSFLTFILTDGLENNSRQYTSAQLTKYLEEMPDHWTVAVLVPDQVAKREAMGYGFPKDNIAIWDATTARGLEESIDSIRQATDNYMVSRSVGVRGSRSVFSTGADAVNAKTIQAAALVPLKPVDYMLVPVTERTPIKAWVEDQCGISYRLGKAFYQLTKREMIQGNKALAVLENATSQVFTGDQVRDLLGLGSMNVQVKPDHNADFTIFVQSTSVNRVLLPGTKLLVLN